MAYSNVQNSIDETSFIIIVFTLFYLFVKFSWSNLYSCKQKQAYDRCLKCSAILVSTRLYYGETTITHKVFYRLMKRCKSTQITASFVKVALLLDFNLLQNLKRKTLI